MELGEIEKRQDRTAGSARITSLAWAGVAGTVCFAASVVLMHIIQPDLSPFNEAVSYYMNGRFGWVLGLGLVSLGAGSLCLYWAIRRAGAVGARLGSWCLALWGAGAAIGGIFPPDPRGHWGEPPSVAGMIHANVAMIAFLLFPIAAVLLSKEVGQLSRSSNLQVLLRVLALSSSLMLLIFFASLVPIFVHRAPFLLGLTERLLLAAYLAWLATAAMSVLGAATVKTER